MSAAGGLAQSVSSLFSENQAENASGQLQSKPTFHDN
jgi:hypothetical protein